MSEIEFTGEWSMKMKFEELAQIRSSALNTRDRPSFENEEAVRDKEKFKDLSNGIVRVNILEELDSPSEPTKQQLLAINFIASNQMNIIKSIYNLLTEIYPDEVIKNNGGIDTIDSCDEKWVSRLPSLKMESDLKNVIGLIDVEILEEHKKGLSFYAINFYACWDEMIDGMYQYGFHVLMHENTVFDWDTERMYNMEKIYEDIGLDYEVREKKTDNHVNSIDCIIVPHKKYGKLRPSEEFFNEKFPFRLLYNNHTTRFIELVEQKVLDINNKTFDWSELLRVAISKENERILNYLIVELKIFEKHKDFQWPYIISLAFRGKNRKIIDCIKIGIQHGTLDDETLASVNKLINSHKIND